MPLARAAAPSSLVSPVLKSGYDMQRFDRFNAKYNPFGQSELREIFMKARLVVYAARCTVHGTWCMVHEAGRYGRQMHGGHEAA